MEEIRLVNEVVTELLDSGYSANFGLMEYLSSLKPVKEIADISGSDFNIDEVYCCHENEYNSEIVYVFAISCAKYDLKGISTSISIVDNSFSFSELFEKMKEMYRRIF
ncbi:hypothetical protein [Chryseobacterium sp. BIGb0232]|uniref:hypothetical protein n=1 Tax=Chryseobacterium sp. BIGb0232 TaxID=2940598 RepID=UPI000F47B09E|nr:hypothetical protein [Chryseobacterium sp. BIGb0232]MCS4301834.1 hypothetical protein [Chryseobacterium sp. BIGb0232]ROS17781.1 hypothetical protein EDF65_2166 [Chryseobacterium nakagawai]